MAKKSRLTILIFMVFLIGVLVVSIGYVFLNLQPVSKEEKRQIFVVVKGESTSSIAKRLEGVNLIKNEYVFLGVIENGHILFCHSCILRNFSYSRQHKFTYRC